MNYAMKTVSMILFLHALAAVLPAEAQTVNLRGRVLDKVGMQPVPEATLKLAGSDLTVTTDAAGRFTLKGASTALASATRTARALRVAANAVELEGGSPGASVHLDLIALDGRLIASAAHVLSAGTAHRLGLPQAPADFLGFLRVSTEEGIMLTRILSLGGSFQPSILLRPPSDSDRGNATRARGAAAKNGAALEVIVSKDKLVAKTVSAAAADMDLGDIVLEYPPRVLGLGARPIYGADVLFPMDGDSAAVRAAFEAVWIHKMNAWRQGQGLGATPVLWKVMADPEAAAGTFKPSLSPCCVVRNGSPGWGYDDIITKKQYLDVQVHLEFNMMGLPDGNAGSAGYCNSGVYLRGNLELQIETPKANPSNYEKLHSICTLIDIRLPDKNMYPGPGIWQSYDITLRAPRADSPAKVSVWWNKELVHNNQNWQGAGTAGKVGFALQNELGSDVRYRNVWIKELDIRDAQTNFGY